MTATDALKSLHTSLIDAENGYGEAIKDAKAPEMRAFFEKMSALHRRADADVQALLVAKGEPTDDSGSFMSTVHKTIISVRSAISGLDRSSLSSFADGEKRIAGAYDDAIEENRGDVAAVEKLRRHKEELLAMIALMEQKAA